MLGNPRWIKEYHDPTTAFTMGRSWVEAEVRKAKGMERPRKGERNKEVYVLGASLLPRSSTLLPAFSLREGGGRGGGEWVEREAEEKEVRRSALLTCAALTQARRRRAHLPRSQAPAFVAALGYHGNRTPQPPRAPSNLRVCVAENSKPLHLPSPSLSQPLSWRGTVWTKRQRRPESFPAVCVKVACVRGKLQPWGLCFPEWRQYTSDLQAGTF
ncbi:uncharacterized protein LOC129011582 [Pongo pygmaeus]|uniref:uncharacterized protein LOC129011582 n=1 Tax=Pongo pygmaeus TaxID=9600 RepID=UPI0023E18BD7|nr:uncharacterized protein LOC129011582 [Pongo pygmaeus]